MEAAPQAGSPAKRLEQYKLVAQGVADCFALYVYFVSLVGKVDPADWEKFKKTITVEQVYKKKWELLEKLAQELQKILEAHSTKENRDLGNWFVGKSDFTASDSAGILKALENFKKASDLILDELRQLDPSVEDDALEMINKAIEAINPSALTESSHQAGAWSGILESNQKLRNPPAESSILQLADMMAAQIINLRITLRQLADTLPQLKTSADQSESNVLDPLAKEIKNFLRSDYKPKQNERLPVPKQVKQLYATKGWDVETQFQKYMIDAWEKLQNIQKQVEEEWKKIEGYKKQAVDKYQVRNDAQEFIEVGQRILAEIRKKVRERIMIKDLKDRAGSILPYNLNSQNRTSGQDGSGGSTEGDKSARDAEILRNYLIKKYQNKEK